MVIRLRDRYSKESIAAMPKYERDLVMAAEAVFGLSDPVGGDDCAILRCTVKTNAAWQELERLAEAH